jgi:hypothetical protein
MKAREEIGMMLYAKKCFHVSHEMERNVVLTV